MPVINNTGPGTQSPWDTSGFAFSPNTNTLDPVSMPSNEAEAARQKSAQIMEALRSGKPGEADRLMGENQVKQGQLVPLKWLKGKMSRKKGGEEAKSIDSEVSSTVDGGKA